MKPINIQENLTGVDFLIAQKCDDGNGVLEKEEVSIFNKAKEEFQASGEKQECTIKGIKYCYSKILDALLEIPQKLKEIGVEKNDATYVDKEKYKIEVKLAHEVNKPEKTTPDRQEIVSKMYQKWSGKFKDSPLKEDFYDKLYDVIKTLHCSVSDDKFDSSKYSSKEEQTMDEVIAIFAGEARLNPKAKNGIYRGIFQLATPGLTDLKKWAKAHPDVPGMDNIKQDMNISGFANLSGNDQLDYLVAYIGKSREYSKLGADETISPGQLWAMIKYPFKGKSTTNVTASKEKAIQNVFKASDIKHGIS